MRIAFMAAVLTVASGCAASDRMAGAQADGARPAVPANVADVRTVAIESFANEPVCNRRAPTGSRIAVQQCEARTADDASRAATRDRAREELGEMRQRQQALMRERL